MSGDYTQARLQRMEEDLRVVKEHVSVLSVTEAAVVKRRIADTFEGNSRMVIIYQGTRRGMTQTKIAQALRDRGLPTAQQRVSEAQQELEERGFLKRVKAGYLTRDETALNDYGLDRKLRETLRRARIDEFP